MNTVSLLVTAVAGFLISSLLGLWLIPFLRRLHYGQTILEIGPSWHKKKQGTPTMGGIMFIVGSVLAVTIGCCTRYLSQGFQNADWVGFLYLVCGVAVALALGAMGFADDYIKVVKKQNLGLRPMQKIVAQVAIAVLFLAAQQLFDPGTSTFIPFIGTVDLGVFYYLLMLFLLIGVPNAVNLTDGIDGLCGSVTFVASLGFMILAAMLAMPEMNLLAAALAGSCLGFLMWNFHPAKVFMGDTGSMFLGGMVMALAVGLRMPVILLFIGFIYMVETLSVIMQVTSFKLTGKRIFKMSPIHHHFEMSGWSEVKIVAVFSAVTFLGCLVAVGAVWLQLASR